MTNANENVNASEATNVDATKTPEVSPPPAANNPESSGNNGRLFSLGFGAVVAAVILSGYSLVSMVGGVVVSVAPYLAGGALFISLMTIFLSIVTMQKKLRKAASKNFAIWDCYTSLATIATLGYFAAACVATFQPGGNPSTLWTHGIATAALFALLFGGGKWAGQLFNEGGSKSR
jgi:hypothetical protein